MSEDISLEIKAAKSIGRSFRKEIWQDNEDLPMTRGYSNEGKPFDINTALYMREPWRTVKNPSVRKNVWKAGVQALKTYGAEKAAAYFIAHDPGEMAIYDATEEMARDHCKSRLMPMLRAVPGISDQIAEVQSRHDISTTEFYLPGMTLRVWPLNLSSTQRITLRYVIIHDAFLSGSTGMIDQAIARTTQHPTDKVVIIESQGSDEQDDFDRHWKTTDMRELHVKCPFCDKGQPFEFGPQREDGTYAGFHRGPDEKILLPDGSYDDAAIIRETYYECLHCRAKWYDIPEIRHKLDESAYYVATNPGANPENVGFQWPGWINRNLSWGRDIMLEYLSAKRADKDSGLKDPLKQWYQKRAAKTWSERMAQTPVPIQVGGYDPNSVVPNEHHRGMIIDVQKHPRLEDTAGSFWFKVYAADKMGNSFEIDRGYIEPKEDKSGWEQLREIQEKWKIFNHHVRIDGRKWTPEILNKCAEYAEWARFKIAGREIWMWNAWQVLLGDGPSRSYKWKDGVSRVWSPPTLNHVPVVKNDQTIKIPVYMFRWSNLSIKDQLHTLLIGGEGKPKVVALKREQTRPETQLKEVGEFSYDIQMRSEYRTEQKNGVPLWDKVNTNVQNHYWDLACMMLVQMGQHGLASHQMAPE